MLPGINIEFDNGNIGAVVPSPDGCFGLVTMADEVADTFVHETPYVVKSMQDVAALGLVDDIGNHRLYKFLFEFFQEGGSGQELWLMAFSKMKPNIDPEEPDEVVLMSELFTPDVSGLAPAEMLLNASNGKLRGLFALFNPSAAYVPVITNGIDDDVALCLSLAQPLLEDYTDRKSAPAFMIIEGYAFNGNHISLPDFTQASYNRIGVMIGDTEKRTGDTASKGAAIGVLAGRLAKNRVHVNIGKVRDGALNPLGFFIVDTPVESYDVDSIHSKGFITLRSHVGKSGYFFSDDPLACEISDDYHYLARRRTIDKAYRIAYTTALNYVLDEVPVNNDGTVSPFYAKTIEGHVEREVYNQMTLNGELSSNPQDSKDLGVTCKVDLTVNIVATSRLKMTLRVRPFGYNRWIDILLGFDINND